MEHQKKPNPSPLHGKRKFHRVGGWRRRGRKEDASVCPPPDPSNVNESHSIAPRRLPPTGAAASPLLPGVTTYVI